MMKDRLDILRHSLSLSACVLLLAAAAGTLPAAARPGASEEIRTPERAPEEVYRPDADRLAAFRDQPAFRYDHTPTASENFLQRIWRQIAMWLASLLDNRATSLVWQLLPYLLLAAAVAGLVFILIGNTPAGIFRKREKADLDVEEVHEDVHAIDFEQEIQRAAREGRFRDAVRLMYLQVLKRLTDAGEIRWRPEKTNRDYLLELQGSNLRGDFSRLTRFFEFIWYGDFRMDRRTFDEARSTFTSISGRIPSS